MGVIFLALFIGFYSSFILIIPVKISAVIPKIAFISWAFLQSFEVPLLSLIILTFIVIAQPQMIHTGMVPSIYLECPLQRGDSHIVLFFPVIANSNMMIIAGILLVETFSLLVLNYRLLVLTVVVIAPA